MPRLPDDVRGLVDAPNFLHVATVLPDGSPHVVAVWASVEGERIAFFTQPRSRKARNLKRDPRVAMSVVDFENPYLTARIRGHVSDVLSGEEALEVIDRLSIKYTGAPFPVRTGIVFLIEPESAVFTELPFRHEPAAQSRS